MKALWRTIVIVAAEGGTAAVAAGAGEECGSRTGIPGQRRIITIRGRAITTRLPVSIIQPLRITITRLLDV